ADASDTCMPAILAFEKISKRFGAVVVARALDLALAEGEALGIIGPNGAGKTTLFGIASGTVAPDAGRVIFAGIDITHLAPERRCRLGIGRSFQIPQPFNGMTVFENLVVAAAFGGGRRERDVYARCVELIEQCGLAAKANRPAGSLTLLDRKRLELARALATEPRVLLLDEVAGGLTEHECMALVDLIRDIRRGGISIIWIEHVVHALVALVDRLVVLHGGGLIGEGAPQAVIAAPAVRDIYMGIPPDPLAPPRPAPARRRLPRPPGAGRRLPARAGRRGGRPHLRQRRRPIAPAQVHRRRDRITPRCRRLRRRAERGRARPYGGRPRHCARSRRAAAVPLALGRGEPHHRRPAWSAGAVEPA